MTLKSLLYLKEISSSCFVSFKGFFTITGHRNEINNKTMINKIYLEFLLFNFMQLKPVTSALVIVNELRDLKKWYHFSSCQVAKLPKL